MAATPAGDHWIPAYIGIGSNLDDPVAQVRRAIMALGALPATRFVVASRLYRNPPLDHSDQPEFVNAVAGVLTRLGPPELLAGLLAIEAAHGRRRDPATHWGPRALDLDLLAYGERTVAEPGLTVPHPGVAVRNFVLLPLNEIAPGLWLPGLGPVAALVHGVAGHGPLCPVTDRS
jgi:2-amino-4-hydroxy-6-hydroxymethyldihydropteridine diphosphokinase